MNLYRSSIFLLLCLITNNELQADFSTPAQEEQTLTGIYWLLAGSYCWHTAGIRIAAACATKFEYESLGMRKLTPDMELRVRKLLDDLHIDPEHTISLRRFNTSAECGTPAAATSHTIYINQEECATYSDKELRAILAHEWTHLSEKHVTISIPLYICIPFLAEGIVRSTLWLGNEAIKSVTSWKVKLACNAVHAACSWVAATGLPTCLLAMSVSSYLERYSEYRADKQAAVLHADNTQGLIQSFKRLAQDNPAAIDRCSLTHPSLRNRIQALGGTAEDEAELDALIQK